MTQFLRSSRIKTATLSLCLVGAVGLAALGSLVMPAAAEPGSEQASARNNVRSGGAMKIGQIESIVLPQMRGFSYIGFTYYPVENIYRLRFLSGIKAIDVDVDARNGHILSRTN